MLFVYSMLTMALIGATMAALKANPGTVNGGLLTAYLVITGLATVRPATAASRRQAVGAMLLGLAVALTDLTFGFQALASASGMKYGYPSVPYVIFGSVALLASVGDIRLIRLGGVHAIRGAPRLARHLWRMSFALLIAAFSFFIGQAQVIPKPIRIYPLLAIPPLAALVAMLYWLWRVRARRSPRGESVRAHEAMLKIPNMAEATAPSHAG